MFVLVGMLSAPALAGEAVLESDFTGEAWLERFSPVGAPPWTEGLERARRVFDEESGRYVLEVEYPKGKYGNAETGAQWPAYFGGRFDTLTLTYRVRFEPGFEFVKGGKLPGLIGGHRKGHPHSTLTGGHKFRVEDPREASRLPAGALA